MSNKYFITTSIFYINDKPHVGHAYELAIADVLARYRRQHGEQVLFSTGTDENSQKTVQAAEKADKDLETYTDEMARDWQEVWKQLNISHDRFIRTTEPAHKRAVYTLLERIKANGDIYRDSYEGWYCVGCEEFKKESELVDGLCSDHQREPEWIEEENYFFKLSDYAQSLLKHIEEYPEFIQPASRRHEVVSFIKQGLDNISISRQDKEWGITYPFDEDHVIYVWFEALINYLTVTGYPEEGYQEWWPADVHVIGKNITKFHCIIWPAMLMSAGLPLPKTVVAHGFLNIKGTKISKSLGNVINPLDLTKEFGVDALRYILLRDTPFGEDGDFTLERFRDVYNAELADDLGNLVQRVASMIVQYQEGVIGEMPPSSHDVTAYHEAMANYEFTQAIEEIRALVHGLNQYVEEEKPWELAKNGEEQHLSEVLSHLVGNILQVAELLQPFMPRTAERIQQTFADDVVHEEVGILFPKKES